MIVGTGIGDSRNMTSLDAASSAVSLKLNKRGNQAIWAFDIKGVVSCLRHHEDLIRVARERLTWAEPTFGPANAALT